MSVDRPWMLRSAPRRRRRLLSIRRSRSRPYARSFPPYGAGRPLHFGPRRRFGSWFRPGWPFVAGTAALALAAAGGAYVVLYGPGAGGRGSVSPALVRARAALAAAVTTSPTGRTSAVPLDAPVTVTTRSGRLVSVAVTDGSGRPLSGGLDPTATVWTAPGPLEASTTYRIDARVTGPRGISATATSRFTTVTPTALVTASIWPDDGLSVGVGEPIVLRLSQPVEDPAARQALLAHLHLSLSAPVPVGAFWFSATEMHLRPEAPWATGERIALSDSLDGWDAGGGRWGHGTGSATFSVGDARVSTANLATHRMTVTDNGRVVADYPISAGSTSFPTMNGVHIVMDRESRVHMVSSSVGIPVNSPAGYDETVYSDVHISDSGEYVHAAPWSVRAQGSENVSHGCINLSPTDAQQFFGFSRVGDIVWVVGGPRPPVPGDHGVMDWLTPWSSFSPVPVAPLTG